MSPGEIAIIGLLLSFGAALAKIAWGQGAQAQKLDTLTGEAHAHSEQLRALQTDVAVLKSRHDETGRFAAQPPGPRPSGR